MSSVHRLGSPRGHREPHSPRSPRTSAKQQRIQKAVQQALEEKKEGTPRTRSSSIQGRVVYRSERRVEVKPAQKPKANKPGRSKTPRPRESPKSDKSDSPSPSQSETPPLPFDQILQGVRRIASETRLQRLEETGDAEEKLFSPIDLIGEITFCPDASTSFLVQSRSKSLSKEQVFSPDPSWSYEEAKSIAENALQQMIKVNVELDTLKAAADYNLDRYRLKVKEIASEYQDLLCDLSHLSYVFFLKFAKSYGVQSLQSRKELSKQEVDILETTIGIKEIYAFYEEQLTKNYQTPPESIGLYFDQEPSVTDCEIKMQAAHNVAQIMTRLYETLHTDFPICTKNGSYITNEIEYFFALIEDKKLLGKIVELDLRRLALTWIPRFFFCLNFSGLRQIDLQDNLLSHIPSLFLYRAVHLTVFTISNNPTKKVEDDFGQAWEEIEEIHAEMTRLTSLPYRNFAGKDQLVLSLRGAPLDEGKIPPNLRCQLR